MAELQLLWEDKVGYLDAGDDNGENDDVNKDDDDDANNDLLSVAELQLLWEDKVCHHGHHGADDDNDVNKDDDDDDDANNDLLSVAELQLLWEDKVLMMMLKIVRLIDEHFEKNIYVSFALWCVQVHFFSLGLFYVSEFNSLDVQCISDVFYKYLSLFHSLLFFGRRLSPFQKIFVNCF